MAIRIDKVSVTPGEHVGVDLILGDDFHARPAEIRFTVLAIDDVTTMWRTTVVAGVITETPHGWSGELDTSWLQDGELCELSRAELIGGDGEYVLAVVESGPHERALFEGRSADATPRPAEAVVAAVREVEDRRRLREAEPLSAPGPGPMHAFRVLLFVERLLLRSVLRVPGMQLVPLAHGNVSRDEAFIINRALRELGWQAAVDPQWWAEHSNEAKPMVLLRADRVLAPDHTAALVAASDVRDHLLDLLARRRGGCHAARGGHGLHQRGLRGRLGLARRADGRRQGVGLRTTPWRARAAQVHGVPDRRRAAPRPAVDATAEVRTVAGEPHVDRAEGPRQDPRDPLAARARGGSTVVSEALSASGDLLQRVQLDGANGYTFTADILAWGAMTAAADGVEGTGARGPVSAFALDALEAGARQAGLARA